VAHLAEPTSAVARVPLVDRWPRVVAAVAQAPGGLGRALGTISRTGTHQAGAATAVRWRRAKTMAPVGCGGATVVACGGEQACEARNTPGFLEERRKRGEWVTGADKSTKNPHGCTVHRGGERFESAWLTASGRVRCSPEVEGGWRAPVWSLRGWGGGEVGCHRELDSAEGRLDGLN
jgi:hypothetical protein